MAKKKEQKVVKCYFCGRVIENSHDHVIKLVPMATKSGVRKYKRQLHVNCVNEYNKGLENEEMRKEENSDWDLCYKYFRKEILGLNETVPLSDHPVKRLLGLRLGQYYPSGNNTRILPRGYDFKVILLTMKLVRPRVQAYLATGNFNNDKHKIDTIMKFITREISDVAKRVELQDKANQKLDNSSNQPPSFDYKEALKRQKGKDTGNPDESNGIGDLVGSLLGGSL